ncbi:hypothetical protein PIB30_111938, partial [Stylosanthes scabra]|nr:hypothetical protein [Stylosanthes scabra]
MASPFKNKNAEESVKPKDIKNLIEQSNYTNRFLQCLGDNLSSSKSSSLSLQNVSEASTSKPIEKPLFKPFKMSSKAKQTLKTSILKQDTSESEVMQKIDLLLQEIKQDETGRVEIVFDRRNSFSSSSRSEAGIVNDFTSARRSFSVTSQSQFSSRIPRS